MLPARPHGHRHRAHRARALLGRPDARPRAATRCATRGARIALDDAGNGYAGPAADHPHRARHPQARPLARRRHPRRPAPLRAARGAHLASPRRPARRCAPRAWRRCEDLAVLAGMDVTYAQGWALARPGRAVGRARAAGRGRRDGRGPDRPARAARDRAPTARADARRPHLAALTRVAPHGRPRGVRGDDPDGARGRGRRGLARRARRALRRGHQPPRLVAARRALLASTTTRRPSGCCARARAGQVVVGDPASDPAEVELLERNGFGAVLHGPARLRRPRRRAARALPPPRAAVEQRGDRARAAARAPARGGHRPARAGQPTRG